MGWGLGWRTLLCLIPSVAYKSDTLRTRGGGRGSQFAAWRTVARREVGREVVRGVLLNEDARYLVNGCALDLVFRQGA